MTRTMKDSGIEWIGEIPEHFEVIRNKYFISYIKGKNPQTINDNKQGVPYIGASELDNISGNCDYKNYTEDVDLPTCNNEDVLVLWDGARAGLVGRNHCGAISSTIVNVNPNINVINKHFWFYYIKGFEQFLYDRVNGTTIPHMNKKFIDDIRFINFNLPEQEKIAEFLDEKCSHIDAVLEKTRASIDEYKQLKQSVITQAVTKGIRPNRPMKDSGIEWIGEIPEDWKVSKIKFVAKFNPQYTVETNDNDIVTFAPMECIKNGYYINKETSYQSGNTSYTPFQEGDIVVAKVTPCFENGNIAIMEGLSSGYGYGSSELFVLRPFDIDTKYLFYYLQNESFKRMGCSTMTGTGGLKRVSPIFIQNYSIPYFSKSEQIEIANYLDDKCAEIDKLITKKEQLIEELETYKKSLIYEYVTGKKEVCK